MSEKPETTQADRLCAAIDEAIGALDPPAWPDKALCDAWMQGATEAQHTAMRAIRETLKSDDC